MTTLEQSITDFLTEDNTNSTIPSSGNVITHLNHEEQEHALQKVNSLLTAITDSPVLNPYYLVERIKTRLKLALGLSFDDSYFLGDIGSFEKPLFAHNDNVSVYGGITQSVPNDNGWLKLFPRGLVIRFQFLKNGNLYNVNAEIVLRPEPQSPPPISEA